MSDCTELVRRLRRPMAVPSLLLCREAADALAEQSAKIVELENTTILRDQIDQQLAQLSKLGQQLAAAQRRIREAEWLIRQTDDDPRGEWQARKDAWLALSDFGAAKVGEDRSTAVRALLESHFWLPTIEANKSYDRLHDDHDGTNSGSLRVMFSEDGDAWVLVENPEGTSLRYRTGAGGGRSLHVRTALHILAEAIRMDNELTPTRRPLVKPATVALAAEEVCTWTRKNAEEFTRSCCDMEVVECVALDDPEECACCSRRVVVKEDGK